MTVGFNLKANSRSKTGSAESRRIRNSGQVPAVIYNKNGNLNINIPAKELEVVYHKGNLFTTIAQIELDGKKIKALPHKIELHPVTDRLIHVDFVEVVSGKPVKAKVKLNFNNKDKSPGLKKGGFLHIVLRKVEVLCNENSIPSSIDVEIGSMKVGDKIKSSNLTLPKDAKFANKKDFIIGSIIGRGSKDDEDKAVAAEGAAPAEGTDAKAVAGADKKEAEKKPAAKK
jgi:large subunit ribosomal protein L25